jgi:hypothetical protein
MGLRLLVDEKSLRSFAETPFTRTDCKCKVFLENGRNPYEKFLG